MFVLSTKFADSALKLSINWPIAVIFSIFNWKSGKKIECGLFCGFKATQAKQSHYPTIDKPR
jgi:hypothetical protein